MIYHNYSIEIYDELSKKYYQEEWNQKNIVIFGFNVIGMVIASFLNTISRFPALLWIIEEKGIFLW